MIGRQWGKTHLVAWKVFTNLIRHRDVRGAEGAVYAPSNYHTLIIYERIHNIAADFGVKLNFTRHPHRYIRYRNATYFFKTADNPDAIRGGSWNMDVVVDEIGVMKYEAWVIMQPTFVAHNPGVHLFGTPNGKNWLYDLYHAGRWHPSTGTTFDNTLISRDSIDALMAEMPERMQRQEIYAQFLDVSHGVFKMECCRRWSGEGPLRPGEKVIAIGCDLGDRSDYTVLVPITSEGRVLKIERFRRIGWANQVERISRCCQDYPDATLMLDSTGVGAGVLDFLRKGGVKRIWPITFSNRIKNEMVKGLEIAIERGTIQLPYDDMLDKEFAWYECHITPSGNMTYSAPQQEGKHDDMVVGVMLAWHFKQVRSGGAGMVNIPRVG